MTTLEGLARRGRALPVAWPRLDVVAVAAVILICVIAWARHASIHYRYDHIDEVIAVKVAQWMLAHHSVETNWANADLPDYFKYPQYNFSAYNLFCAGVLDVARHVSWLRLVDPLQILRKTSFVLGLLGILLAHLTGRRLFGATAGLFAAVLAGANPLLFQDAMYARPEAFVSALSLLLVYVLMVSRWPALSRQALAALILGVLVATKISMIALVPLLFLADEPTGERASFTAGCARYAVVCLKRAPATFVVAAPALVLGFLAGAPAAPFHVDAFLSGVRALTTQYTTGHWPHGLPDGGVVERLGFAAAYVVSTMGWAWALLAVGSIVFLVRERRFRALGVWLIVAASCLRLSTYAVFFERNLSHLIPILCLFGGFALDRLLGLTARIGAPAVLRQAVAVAAMALVIATPAVIVYRLLAEELPGHSKVKVDRLRSDMENRYGVPVIPVGWAHEYGAVKRKTADVCASQLLEVTSPGDRYTAATLARLKLADRFSEVGRFASVFAYTSPSTLRVYFTPTTIFLYHDGDTAACRSRPSRIVSRADAGEVLPAHVLQADPAWTRAGSPESIPDPFAGLDFFASWSGSDARTGQLAMLIDVGGLSGIVVPYTTGPVPAGQSITIEDADTHRVIFQMNRIEPAVKWSLLNVRLPKGVRQIVLKASDTGAEWGNWLAVGAARRSQRPAA